MLAQSVLALSLRSSNSSKKLLHPTLRRRRSTTTNDHLQSLYHSMIAKQNGIHLDVYQLRAIQALDRLYNDLKVDKEDAPTSFFWSSAKPQPPQNRNKRCTFTNSCCRFINRCTMLKRHTTCKDRPFWNMSLTTSWNRGSSFALMNFKLQM